jgi:hypothetical protein
VRAGRVVPVSPWPRADERRCEVRLVGISIATCTRRSNPAAKWRMRVRQNRVVLAVVATVKLSRRCVRAQPGRQHHPIREAREARRKVRLPGEHGISRPTIAQGRPSDWLHLYAAVRFSCVCFSRSGPRVRGQHPAFPAPSWTRRAERPGKARAKCAASTRRRVYNSRCELEEWRYCLILRHCECSEAIQSAAAERFWIASLRSQRRFERVRATRHPCVSGAQRRGLCSA